MSVYPNLEAEIARHNLNNDKCAELCGITNRAFSCKRTGKNEFTLSEMKAIQRAVSSESNPMSIDYLFSNTAG